MKVIIDARMIDKNLHGIARYTYELIKGLYIKDDMKIQLITNDLNLTQSIFEDCKELEYIKMKSKFLSPLEIFEFPIILNKYKHTHIFHTPSFSASPFIKLKSFITIHDLNHLALPQYYTMFHQVYYDYVVKPFSLKCKKIFTVSNFSKGEILSWLNCQENKVCVTYNGIDRSYKVINDSNLLNSIRDKYELPEKFVLYIGNQKPHKNVKTLVKSMRGVNSNVHLVLNGKCSEELHTIIEDNNLKDRVKFIGYVEENDLPYLYNIADVFVFPSLYEGFGLPPLEAISCGCPTIVADCTALPEIVGDLAIKVSATDIDAFSKNINMMVSENYKIKFRKKNKPLLEQYDWIKMVDRTYAEYKTIKVQE